MYTKRIVLESCLFDDFEELRTSWDIPHKQPKKSCNYFRIVNTIEHGLDYEKLINWLIEHPAFCQLSVRQGNKWRRFNSGELIEDNSAYISELAVFAAKDIVKRNFFEVRYKRDLRALDDGKLSYSDLRDTARVHFAELQDRVVAYEAVAPIELVDLFTFNSIPEGKFNEGILDLPRNDS